MMLVTYLTSLFFGDLQIVKGSQARFVRWKEPINLSIWRKQDQHPTSYLDAYS